MKLIPLGTTNRALKHRDKYFAQVDDEDYEWLMKYKWHLSRRLTCFYAATNIRVSNRYKMVGMHRIILNLSDPKIHTDHIDRNGLNNQRKNLRACTQSENSRNRTASGASKYLGVSIKQYTLNNRYYRYWVATIKVNGKNKQLGHFKNQESAALAYNSEVIKHYGEFSNLNIIALPEVAGTGFAEIVGQEKQLPSQ